MGDLWHQIVEAAGRASPFTKTYLLEAHPVSIEKHVFTIGFDPEFADHLSLVDNSKVHTLLQTKLKEYGHAGMMVRFVEAARPHDYQAPELAPVGGGETGGGAVEAGPKDFTFDKEEFKNDPLIKSALDIFKGQIVEIRK